MYSATAHVHTQLSPKAIQPTIPSPSNLKDAIKHADDFRTWKRADNTADSSLLSADVDNAPPDFSSDKTAIDIQMKKTAAAKEKEKDKGDDAHPQKGGDDDSTEGHKEGHTRVHAPEDDDVLSHIDHDQDSSPHAYIGVALILGYILMFLVDHLPDTIAASKPKYMPMHISLSNLHRGPHNASSLSLNGMASEAVTPLATPMPPHLAPKKTSATTIGLVVHACADGIALGASSTAPSTSLSLVIFFAIMLHKAPAAFGLTSVLLKQGLSKKTVRAHLAIFSLAAPAGALATWAIVHAIGRGRLGGDDSLKWLTGWVLCFSGGTFLYVYISSYPSSFSSLLDASELLIDKTQIRSNALPNRSYNHTLPRRPHRKRLHGRIPGCKKPNQNRHRRRAIRHVVPVGHADRTCACTCALKKMYIAYARRLSALLAFGRQLGLACPVL